MAAVYIILIIISLIMLIMLLPADFIINISYNDSEMRNAIFIKYAFVKFKIYPSEAEEETAEKKIKEDKKEKKQKEKKKRESGIGDTVNLVKTVYRELKEDILKLWKHFLQRTFRIKELNISAKFGTGDPMYTGIVSGTVNAAVYNAVSLIDRTMTLDKWNVSLEGDFDNVCLNAGVYAKFRTRILFALRLGIMAVVLLLRIQKINRRIKKDV